MIAKKINISPELYENDLSEREREILRTIIHLYIINAAPVGSRVLSKYLERDLKLSPATIRNVMSDLEALDYISHPHTSAGRIPTDKGYRFYVDSMNLLEKLSDKEVRTVRENLKKANTESILRDASKILGVLSKCLALVEIPHLTDLIVQKVELIYLNSKRLLAVIALDSNIVRTVTLEADFEIKSKNLDAISGFINERISYKPLKYIKDNFKEMLSDFDSTDAPLVRLFVDSLDMLFESHNTTDRIHIAGTQNLLTYPEFEDLDRVKGIIELVENEDIIIHILDQYESTKQDFGVLIGREMKNEMLDDYSLVVSSYNIGSATGSIGLIGPKRMNYSKMVSLVQYVANILSKRKS